MSNLIYPLHEFGAKRHVAVTGERTDELATAVRARLGGTLPYPPLS